MMFFVSFVYIVSADQKMSVDIDISSNNIITENIALNIDSDESYDIVEFSTLIRPLSVNYDGIYNIEEVDDTYVIKLEKSIVPGQNTIKFALLFDDIIDQNGPEYVFRTSFYPEDADELAISITLPMHFALSDKEPSSIPKPNEITSDGQQITLSWNFIDPESADLSIFYSGPSSFLNIMVGFIIILIVISVVLFYYFSKKTKKQIEETLSSEELKIVDQVKQGVKTQKEIAKNLEFSKSKMSKVLRKLEEKGLIEKEVHFKTYILKLKKL